jgi:hypothetical protein
MTLDVQSMADDPQDVPLGLRLRRGLALPLYTVALILSFASDLLGCLAARIADDDWPR